MLSSPLLLIASAASVVLPFLAPVEASCAHGIAGIHPFERRGHTDEHVLHPPKFGYDIEDGPLNWHTLAPENAMCAEGTHQSPIIVRTESHRVADKGAVKLSMPSNQTDVYMNNLGTTVEMLLDGTLWAGNKSFSMVNAHFHTPSEHRIDLAHHEAEMHMVFQNPDDKAIAVLAFLIDVAAFDSDPALERVLAYLPAVQQPLTSYKIPTVDMADFVAAAEDQDYYIYSGSFTTPPCTEGITFHVATKPLKLRAQTFIGLKKLTKTNARNSQAEPGHVSVLSSMAKSVTALEAALAAQAALVETPQKQERRSAHF